MSSGECLTDILQKIFWGFKANAEAHSCVWHAHLCTLLCREEAEDGGGRMYGQRLAVEEVCGSSDHLQLVDE